MAQQQTPWQAAYIIVSNAIGGALIAAISAQFTEPREPSDYLLAGLLLGSTVGLFASLRRNK